MDALVVAVEDVVDAEVDHHALQHRLARCPLQVDVEHRVAAALVLGVVDLVEPAGELALHADHRVDFPELHADVGGDRVGLQDPELLAGVGVLAVDRVEAGLHVEPRMVVSGLDLDTAELGLFAVDRGGGAGVASGTFTNCVADQSSFGDFGTLSGKLYWCRLTFGSFETVSGGGQTRMCLNGSNVLNNQG